MRTIFFMPQIAMTKDRRTKTYRNKRRGGAGLANTVRRVATATAPALRRPPPLSPAPLANLANMSARTVQPKPLIIPPLGNQVVQPPALPRVSAAEAEVQDGALEVLAAAEKVKEGPRDVPTPPIAPTGPPDLSGVEKMFGIKFDNITKTLPAGARLEDMPVIFSGNCESVLDESGERVFSEEFDGIPYHQIMLSRATYVRTSDLEELCEMIDIQDELYVESYNLDKTEKTPDFKPTYTYSGDMPLSKNKDTGVMSGGRQGDAARERKRAEVAAGITLEDTRGLTVLNKLKWGNAVLEFAGIQNNDIYIRSLIVAILFNGDLALSRNASQTITGFAPTGAAPSGTIGICTNNETIVRTDAFYSSIVALGIQAIYAASYAQAYPTIESKVIKAYTPEDIFIDYNTSTLRKRLLFLVVMDTVTPAFAGTFLADISSVALPAPLGVESVILRSDAVTTLLARKEGDGIESRYTIQEDISKRPIDEPKNYLVYIPPTDEEGIAWDASKNADISTIYNNYIPVAAVTQLTSPTPPISVTHKLGHNTDETTDFWVKMSRVQPTTAIRTNDNNINITLADTGNVQNILTPRDLVAHDYTVGPGGVATDAGIQDRSKRNLLLLYLSNLVYSTSFTVETAFPRSVLYDQRMGYIGGFAPDPIWTLGTADAPLPSKHRIHAFYRRVSDYVGPTGSQASGVRGLVELYIVFRGSETLNDWAAADYEIGQGKNPNTMTRVNDISKHIRNIYNRLAIINLELVPGGGIENKRNVIVYSAGHSLGGFLALMAASKSYSEQFSGGTLTGRPSRGPPQDGVRATGSERARQRERGDIEFKNQGLIIPVAVNPFLGIDAWAMVTRGNRSIIPNYILPVHIVRQGYIFRIGEDDASKLAQNRPYYYNLSIFTCQASVSEYYEASGQVDLRLALGRRAQYHSVENFTGSIIASDATIVLPGEPRIQYIGAPIRNPVYNVQVLSEPESRVSAFPVAPLLAPAFPLARDPDEIVGRLREQIRSTLVLRA